MINSTLTGKMVRFSASAFGTFEDCNLKWWFNKVAGFPTPTSPNQQLGTDVHALLETYSRDGIVPDDTTEAGCIASAGIHYVPDQADNYHVEDELDLMIGPLTFKGYIDAWNHVETPDYTTHVIDYKTTKDFKWALSSEQLSHAHQPLAYIEALIRTDRIERNDFYLNEHIYFRTVGIPIATSVKSLTPDDHVRQNWSEMEIASHKMANYAYIQDPRDVKYNIGSCRKYGGCPFAQFCPRNPNNQQLTLRMDEPMNEQQKRLQAFMKGEESTVRPPDATPSKTVTETQRKECVEFARKASENSDLDDAALFAILNRFQIPDHQLGWLQKQIGTKPPVKSKKVKEDKKTSVEDKPFYVFVDSIPDTGVDMTLDRWAFTYENEVSQNTGKYTDDGKEVGHYLAIPFGKGKTEVLNLLTADLLQGPEWSSIFISSRHALAGPIISLLANMPKAMVIRGVR